MPVAEPSWLADLHGQDIQGQGQEQGGESPAWLADLRGGAAPKRSKVAPPPQPQITQGGFEPAIGPALTALPNQGLVSKIPAAYELWRQLNPVQAKALDIALWASQVPGRGVAAGVKGAQAGILGAPVGPAAAEQWSSKEALGAMLSRQLAQEEPIHATAQSPELEAARRQEFAEKEAALYEGHPVAQFLAGAARETPFDPVQYAPIGAVPKILGAERAAQAAELQARVAAGAAERARIPEDLPDQLVKLAGKRWGRELYAETVQDMARPGADVQAIVKGALGDAQRIAEARAKGIRPLSDAQLEKVAAETTAAEAAAPPKPRVVERFVRPEPIEVSIPGRETKPPSPPATEEDLTASKLMAEERQRSAERNAAAAAARRPQAIPPEEAAGPKPQEPSVSEPVKPPEGKPDWKMTPPEYAQAHPEIPVGKLQESHVAAIREAEAGGQAVPAEVRDAYTQLRREQRQVAPEMKPEAPPEEPPEAPPAVPAPVPPRPKPVSPSLSEKPNTATVNRRREAIWERVKQRFGGKESPAARQIEEAKPDVPKENHPILDAVKKIVTPGEGEKGFVNLHPSMHRLVKEAVEPIEKGAVNLGAKVAGVVKNKYVQSAMDYFDETRGLTQYFRDRELQRLGEISLGRETVEDLMSDISLKDQGLIKKLFIGGRGRLTKDQFAVAAKLRNREITTPEIEAEIRRHFEALPGGVKGAVERMRSLENDVKKDIQFIKDNDERFSSVDYKEKIGSAEARLEMIRGNIDRLQYGDKVPLRTDPLTRELSKVIIPHLRMDADNIKTIHDLGAISEEAMLHQYGAYQARFYRPDALAEIPRSILKKAASISGHRLKARIKDLPEEYRARLLDNVPDYVFGRAAFEEKSDIAKLRFFRDIAKQPDIVSATEVPGWKQMPKSERKWGDVAGQWIEPRAYRELNETFDPANQNVLLKTLDLVTQSWALGKTVLNPATHMRNIYANVMMAWTAGIRPTEFPSAMIEGWKTVAAKGPAYQEAVKAGLGMQNFGSGELAHMDQAIRGSTSGSLIDRLHRAFGTFQELRGIKTMARWYQMEDASVKMAIYARARKTMSPTEAVAYVNKHLPDYRQTSRFWDTFGRRAFPLNTFNYRMAMNLPSLATAGMIGGRGNRWVGLPGSVMSLGPPGVSGGWRSDTAATARFVSGIGAYLGIESYLKDQAGLTPEQWKAAPDYAKTGLFMPLRVNKPDGVVTSLDLTNTVPWGSLVQFARTYNFKSPVDVLRAVSPTNPVFQIFAQAGFGYDYKGQRIWSMEVEKAAQEGDRAAQAKRNDALRAYLARSIFPSLIAGVPQRLSAAAQGQEYRGRSQTLPQAAAQSFLGVATQETNLPQRFATMARSEERVLKQSMIERAMLKKKIRQGKATDQDTEDLKTAEAQIPQYKARLKEIVADRRKAGIRGKAIE